jgi:hypothetical protein
MNGWNVGSVKNYLQFLISPTIFRLHCFIICCVLSLLFQDMAYDYYNEMTKEQFKKMQEFIVGQTSKKPSSKL